MITFFLYTVVVLSLNKDVYKGEYELELDSYINAKAIIIEEQADESSSDEPPPQTPFASPTLYPTATLRPTRSPIPSESLTFAPSLEPTKSPEFGFLTDGNLIVYVSAGTAAIVVIIIIFCCLCKRNDGGFEDTYGLQLDYFNNELDVPELNDKTKELAAL